MKEGGRAYTILRVLLLAAAVFAAYANSLDGKFIFDDSRIYNNQHIRITSLDWDSLSQAALASKPVTRPVANLSFALNYYLHGYNVRGYHLVNVCIHLLTGLLLYLLLVATMQTPALRNLDERAGGERLPYEWLAFFAALLWLVHPLQTQSVSYTVQRMNSMAAMFYLASLLCYVRARLHSQRVRKVLLLAASVGCGLLALGSKETSATLPIFIFLYEWYFIQDLDMGWLKRRLPVLALVAGLFAGAAILFLGSQPLDSILGSYGGRSFTLPQRLFTEMRVVFLYLSLLAFPHPSRLTLDHDLLLSTSMVQPVSTLLAAAGLVGMVGAAVWAARRHRLLSFAILWFLGNLLIESSVIALEIVFEHRLYLPTMFLFFVAVVGAYRLLQPRFIKVGVVVGVVLALLLGFWTFERNKAWHDPISLWSDCVAKAPNKARPKNNLGVALKKAGYLREAAEQYQAVIALDPKFIEAYVNLGNIYQAEGRLDEALAEYYKAMDLNGGYAVIHMYIGEIMLDQGKYSRATMYFSEAVRLQPDNVEARSSLQYAQWMWRKSKR